MGGWKQGYPLRRGSSFTFLTPGPHWDFTLKRKRREKDDDAVSLCSLDFKLIIPHTRKTVHNMAEEILPT
ncbi:hypothetical protein AAES_153383 [Amazona aestiva]|uniref:Uncharacterized protein n=1 Tax=Amazona aestiva TaxID=12930 RepID=A0A0Q3LWD9_AMAAE|nr:hypothetical protein AAES_153383 [Amazona aestiva]